MMEKRNANGVLVGKLVGKRPLGKHRCRWKDVKWILKKQNVRRGLDSLGSGLGQVAGCCEHGNEQNVGNLTS